jgi:molybdopterin converting factor small subunit
MRDLSGGKEQVDVPGRTVGEVIAALDAMYPGIQDRLCDRDRLVPTITVSVDGRVAGLGLLEAVGEQSEILFLSAVGGG